MSGFYIPFILPQIPKAEFLNSTFFHLLLFVLLVLPSWAHLAEKTKIYNAPENHSIADRDLITKSNNFTAASFRSRIIRSAMDKVSIVLLSTTFVHCSFEVSLNSLHVEIKLTRA